MGMVGSKLVDIFKNKGFTNLLLKTRKELDLTNQKKVKRFFYKERPDYVILAAAKVGGIDDNIKHQADFLYENLMIQSNVIWSAHETDVKKLLFLGSSCIYPRNCPQPMKEEYFMDGKVEPTNEGYAVAKIAGMKLCQKIFTQFNQCFISCMPTNVYGPNDNFYDDKSHVIPALIRRMHQAKIRNIDSVTIWGSGNSRREFLYVEDLADAIFFLIKNFDSNYFVNIGTGSDISIKELAFLIKKIVDFRGELIFDKKKPDGMPKKLLDSSQINSLGWVSKTDLKTGLKLTYDWYLQNL